MALTQPIPWPPQENSLLSPNYQVQWQVHHCPLTNMHVKAVINLLESALPPPTWAIFQPFSGIIISDRDVNISSPKARQRSRGSNLGEFPAGSCSVSNSVELGLSGDRFGEAETVSRLSPLRPCYINRTWIETLISNKEKQNTEHATTWMTSKHYAH